MNQEAVPFRIYNASAGSGKTYTLTREYLKLILRQAPGQAFREILAITFTNKAVGELKQRILGSLEAFSKVVPGEEEPPLFSEIRAGLKTDASSLRERAGKALQEILHNYAFFDVSTIDRFNHRILRTFARDLGLPANFEVVLDTGALLQRAVDNLILKAGEESQLTEVLLEFALEKSAEDRSWDIGKDLFETGRLLFSENHRKYLRAFEGKEMGDFLRLRESLDQKRRGCEAELTELAREIQQSIAANGLERLDFKSGYFPDFIDKIAAGQHDQDFNAKWKQNFGAEPLYTAGKPEHIKTLLDGLLPGFALRFTRIKDLVYQRAFLSNASRNIPPFTVLGLLQAELKRIEQAESLLPVADFNAIISDELAGQPAPYIYERMGEKYRHYFIDEFQDTSELQWKNLIPLIGNALEGEDLQGRQGSLVLVGDAKQAIYRWRGGHAEQFLGMIAGPGNPFTIAPELEKLPVNYRSRQTLIEFNNEFFGQLAGQLSRESYASLFREGNRQQSRSVQPGLVQIEFLDPDTEDSSRDYQDSTVRILHELRVSGYPWKAICVLTRRRSDGVLLSDRLMSEGIPVISSETLLLRNHPAVAFLIDLLRFLGDPTDRNHRFGILGFLAPKGQATHNWIAEHLEQTAGLLRDSWSFDPQKAALKPTYDILEEGIRQFDLKGRSDAYLIFLLDQALEIALTKDASIATFLEYWDAHSEKLSITAPEGLDAVQLMTVHKAKGLEFPVVIYPFADTDIYNEKQPRLWVPVDPVTYNGFPYLQISSRKEVEYYGEQAAACYREEREKLELDAFNVLYVAHTRAVEALYVITGGKVPRNPRNPSTYSDLYAGYLMENGEWDPGKRIYTRGELSPGGAWPEGQDPGSLEFGYTARDREHIHIVTRSGRLWDSSRESALKAGNTLHYALSMIRTSRDIGPVIRRLLGNGILAAGDRDRFGALLTGIVSHPGLEGFFAPGLRILNEQEIIAKNGVLLRPDRLVLKDGRVALLDYKTGNPSPDHRLQLLTYKEALEDMGFAVSQAVLVYISEHEISIETQ